MTETLTATISPGEGETHRFMQLLERWQSQGVELLDDPSVVRAHLRVVVPVPYNQWEAEVHTAISQGIIQADWWPKDLKQNYTKEEIASAPLFRMIHVGKSPDVTVPRGEILNLQHVTEVDVSGACEQCGAGALQSSALRLPASQLAKLKKLSRIDVGHDEFLFVSEELLKAVEHAIGEALPVQRVEQTGTGTPGVAWWQFRPTFVVTDEAFVPVRYVPERCSRCGAVRLSHSVSPFGPYLTVKRNVITNIALPPLVFRPYWIGPLERDRDGRAKYIPWRPVLVRGDVGRALIKEKIRNLFMVPIIYASPKT